MKELTPNQQKALSAMPARADEIAEHLGYQSTSGVYDLFKRAERRDPTLSITSNGGVWSYNRVAADGGSVAAATPSPRRLTTGEKSSRTKKINDWMTAVERDLTHRLETSDPVSVEIPVREGALDMVMFRTDDHFGTHEEEFDPATGEMVEMFNTEIAQARIWQHYVETIAWKHELESLGYEVDTLNLLMNGDHVTGEDIFPGQAHYIDQTLRGQFRAATNTYTDLIRAAADEFDFVRVVTHHGNHGELRTGNQSADQNADDLMFDAIDLALRNAAMPNVDYFTTKCPTHTEFPLRTHRGYMRHGQAGLGHIGTNSAKKRWHAWLQKSGDQHNDNGWDVAYWGHYHQLKVEPIAGRPVLMGGTLCPTGDYEDSLGIAPGRPGAFSHTVSDTEAVERLNPIYLD